MRLVEEVNAYDYLWKLMNDNTICYQRVNDMYYEISKRKLEKRFDDYINQKFPNGIKEIDFICFCLHKQNEIYKDLFKNDDEDDDD